MRGTLEDLGDRLAWLDRRGYPAYKSIKGEWSAGDWTLHVDHVQGDPFARVDEGGLIAAADLPELARPRGLELGAAIDRLRSLSLARTPGP